MKFNTALMKERLFSNSIVRSRILRDYGILENYENSAAFSEAIFARLDQAPISNPLEIDRDNNFVFRAAVRSIGSNSRSWSSFLKNEQQLATLLCDFDVSLIERAVTANKLNSEMISRLLPGQTSSSDAKSILAWVALLSRPDNYYGIIKRVAESFHCLDQDRKLNNELTFLCVVSFFSLDFSKSKFIGFISEKYPSILNRQLKFPGMSFALASEFLRNLGWNGFKPDRHVKRLLDKWVPEKKSQIEPDTEYLMSLIGSKRKEVHEYLYYSLLGAILAPDSLQLSHVDNLVWLLGTYVEKKYRESNTLYLI
jgi:hypothetical protein